MDIIEGNLYFVSNDFFDRVQDPYLKNNYPDAKRPHYLAFKDSGTDLYWMVPCSSKVDKFERLIQKKQEQHKPTDAVIIIKIFNQKSVLLFQDMFPLTKKYIDGRYIKGGQPVGITNPKLIQQLEKNARKIISLLRRGVRFNPTQPNVLNIEKIMLAELTSNQNPDTSAPKTNMVTIDKSPLEKYNKIKG